jgi:hypothetical protein
VYLAAQIVHYLIIGETVITPRFKHAIVHNNPMLQEDDTVNTEARSPRLNCPDKIRRTLKVSRDDVGGDSAGRKHGHVLAKSALFVRLFYPVASW